MHITCQCLNVSINTKGDGVEVTDRSNLLLSLSPIEQKDTFFLKDLAKVDLVSISKEQSSLVKTRNVGCWVIHCCLNCGMDTHAIHRDRGAACVLVSCQMVTDPESIAKLRDSALYSPVFRIVVNTRVDTGLSDTSVPDLHVPSSMQTSLVALQQQLTEALQREAQQVEERIRSFSEQQYTQLEEFRKRAHEDHLSLARLLSEVKEDGTNANLLHTPPATPDPKGAPTLPPPLEMLKPAQLQSIVSAFTAQLKPQPRFSSPDGLWTGSSGSLPHGSKSGQNSADSEGLFQLEGMDENPPETFQSEDESDTDESGSHDEGIHIPRARDAATASNLARSLPVSVPAFPGEHCHGDDIEEENLHDPMDIAASIKALARSVHGDTVFGDLPRPRFSSQI